ncbi:hypothetical protein N9315_02695 [Alphaproteobacteria bacterium]|nr:hypothetical protein [Alphaproteobacteria bacterium]
MRSTLSTLTVLFILLTSTVSWAEFEDHYIWKMGESFEDVLTKLNWTDPYNCKDKVKGVETLQYLEYPISIAKQPLMVGFHTDLNSINGQLVAHSAIYRVTNISTDKDCKIKKVERLKFCPSNAALVHSEIRYPIVIKDDFREVFNEESELFIGPNPNDQLIDYEFKRSMIIFTVESDKGIIVRRSSFVDGFSDLNNGTVHHSVFKKADDSVSEPYSLCPNGEDRLKMDGKISIPKVTNLEKIYRSTISVVREFEIIRTMYNVCSSSFSENKLIYDKYWEEFLDKNQSLYFNITNKFEQTLSKVSSKSVKTYYQSKFDKRKQIHKGGSFLWRDDEERCNRRMSENPNSISDQYADADKNEVDFDFVLTLSFD